MTLSATYRAKASKCAVEALDERDTVECERLLRIAGYWVVMAQNEEWLTANSLLTAKPEN